MYEPQCAFSKMSEFSGAPTVRANRKSIEQNVIFLTNERYSTRG
ncbi:unnamed protein product [Nezara viridula]|uniref:Uncharacterized protein n=1 Tax=Nezara viridula TaxID=85310 RepID=A0A9P0H2E0_NEZVI|nr:unnamed protein product [Nezara viridula]